MGKSGGTFGRLIIESGSVTIDIGIFIQFLVRYCGNSEKGTRKP